jgi:hypothetical protein
MGDYFYSLARCPWLKSLIFPSSPSAQLPGGEYTGESLSKMNNSTNFFIHTENTFHGVYYDQEEWFDEKKQTPKMS